MNRTPTMTITLQSDQGFTVGECFGARGRVLRGRAPHWLSPRDEWTFRLELSHGMGTVVGRLQVLSVKRGQWRARILGVQRGDRVLWDRWASRYGETGEAPARPRIPASAITVESLAQARRSTPAPQRLTDLRAGSGE